MMRGTHGMQKRGYMGLDKIKSEVSQLLTGAKNRKGKEIRQYCVNTIPYIRTRTSRSNSENM